jgi:hypothetical protein
MKKLKILIGLIILALCSCSETSNSNKLDSDDYNTKEERIEVLKKEIKSFSEFENAEFELFNVNGFSNSRTTLPGASSWDYKFAIKVKPSDIDKWTDGMVLVDSGNYDDSWLKKLIQKRTNDWRTVSEPEIYTRKGDDVIMVVYKTEGKIFKRVVNL